MDLVTGAGPRRRAAAGGRGAALPLLQQLLCEQAVQGHARLLLQGRAALDAAQEAQDAESGAPCPA